MTFSLFICFDGICREAAEFYATVFKSEVRQLMTYGEMPPDPNYTVPEEDKNRVLYCCVPIFGCNVMFSDCASDMSLIQGNNFAPTIGTKDMQEIRRIFNELKEGGEVLMELQKTFWSELYGMVQDKYDIIWQISHEQ